MDDWQLKVENVSKYFKLPHERHSSLKQTVLNWHRRKFEKLKVLKNIDFEVKKGEFFGIVGRNGSGKSTLLKIIAGIYQPTQGQIHINGKLTPFIELGVGFNMELTGRDNIYLNGAILGLTKKEIAEKYDEIVAFAELEKFMDQKLKNYSSGMLVRLAFSIAIQAHTEVLLIDEVLAVGDSNFQRKCYDFFKQAKKNGKTIIFVSHAMSAIQEFCDRALMLKNGKIVKLGKPREISLLYEMDNIGDASGEGEGNLKRPKKPSTKLAKIITKKKGGQPLANFSSRQDIIVELQYDNVKPMPLNFTLFLVKSDGTYVSGYNSKHELGKFTPPKGKGVLTCTIKAGQLTKNSYKVNAAIFEYESSRLIDIMDAGLGEPTPTINIIEEAPSRDGQFNIDASWKA